MFEREVFVRSFVIFESNSGKKRVEIVWFFLDSYTSQCIV